MGSNLARNFARNGNTVAVYNRSTEKTDALMDAYGTEGNFMPSKTVEDFVASLKRPRKAIIMVQAGAATDAVIDQLARAMDEGDIIIDGGNANFTDTIRREKEMTARGIHFVGAGISGGEEGALNGPSIMPGGPAESWETLGPVLESIAANVDGTPCVTHIGPDGAGHFVKMVHNGIESADMQVIGEAYQLLRYGVGLAPQEIADIFTEWNAGDLDSYLIEITAEVLRQEDKRTGKPFIDVIVDAAGQKGTGRWTVKEALNLGVPTTGIGEAVFARALSSATAQREAAQRIGLPEGTTETFADLGIDRGEFIEDVRRALYASKLVAYAQGFDEINAGSQAHDWNIQPGELAKIWRGGCIIRAVPGPHHRGLRQRPRAAVAPARSVLQGRAGPRAYRFLAPRRCHRHPPGPAGTGVRLLAVVLRLPARRPPTGRPHPGPARLLRRAHLPPRGHGRHVPHRVVG